MTDEPMTGGKNSMVSDESHDDAVSQAQRQWIETGMVPVSYLESVTGMTFNSLGSPVDGIAAFNVRPSKAG